MSSSDRQRLAALEALLFLHGEPISFSKIEAILHINEEESRSLVSLLNDELEKDHRGICLISDGKKVQLATKPSFSSLLEEFAKSQLSEDLTPAVMEVLAIISYCAPITRDELERIRGVHSAVTLRNLLLRGLIEKDEQENGSIFYHPTLELLKHLGVANMEDLPDYEKFKELYRSAINPDAQNDNPEAAGLLPNEAAPEESTA